MGIYISGMEMPTGNECLILTIYPDGQCFEHVYNGSFGAREERKAVSVPPHGRLIDAEKLGLSDFDIVRCDGNFKEGLKMLLKKIDEAPTIIPAEEAQP